MTTNDAAEQSQTDEAAGQTPGSTVDGGPTPPSEPDDDQGDRTEAKLRKRAQHAEAERDEARALLDRQRQALVDAACASAGLTERHVRAAEITADTVLTDDGLIDLAALNTAVTAAVDEFGLRKPTRPVPNPQQSAGGGQGHVKASWDTALRE